MVVFLNHCICDEPVDKAVDEVDDLDVSDWPFNAFIRIWLANKKERKKFK